MLPTSFALTQITQIPHYTIDIEVRKTDKVGGVSTIVTPRSQSKALDIRIMCWASCDLSHVQLGHQTFGRPTQIAGSSDRGSKGVSCGLWCPAGQGVAATRKKVYR